MSRVHRELPRLAGGLGLALLAQSACAPSPLPISEPVAIVEITIEEIREAIEDGRTTCREMVERHLQRIATYDRATGLGAITVVNERALARADELDRKLAGRQPVGPLFCAPILVKDNFDTHDLPTTGGSAALLDNLPPDDAFMVRKLREADAIVIAKTNMAEWAFSPRQTVSSSFGTTANAYDLDRVPAGSSGGTASGVAASFGVAGLGSDTGNSIRGPSSHLALFGIRSTIGLTSRDGVIPLAFDRDIAGPMTRTVSDGAKIFDVIAGFDPADPYTEPAPEHREDSYAAFLDVEGAKSVRVGVLRALVDTEDADPEIKEIFARAVDDLRAAGAEIVDPIEIEGLWEHIEAPTFCPRFRYDMFVYLRSRKAPFVDIVELLETGQYSQYIEERLQRFGEYPLDTHPANWDEPCADYRDHERRQAFLGAVVQAMDDAGVDALLYPTWTNPPASLERPIEEYSGDNSQLVAPATGMPAVTVPMGFTAAGLPTGLQLLGRPWAEGTLFRLAFAYEQKTHHRRPPAAFPELTNL